MVRQYHDAPAGQLLNTFFFNAMVIAVSPLWQTDNVIVGRENGILAVLNMKARDVVRKLEG